MIMKKLNNKGFTLIELLAVIVILIAIIGIAIPSITASLERNKDKVDKSKEQIIISAAELCVSDYKNEVARKSSPCYITIATLNRDGYLSDNDVVDSDGNSILSNSVEIRHSGGNITGIEIVSGDSAGDSCLVE